MNKIEMQELESADTVGRINTAENQKGQALPDESNNSRKNIWIS